MSLVLKNHSGPRASDGLARPSPRTAVSLATRRLLTINVDPSALQAIVDAEPQQPTFKFFPKLPVEVQLMIWEYAVGKGPMMIIVNSDTRGRGSVTSKLRHLCCTKEVNWTGAALLGVCRLSRELATRVWGRNVCHIPVPGIYTTSTHVHDVAGCVIADLAADAFYMPGQAWASLPMSFSEDVKISTVAFPYDPQRNSKCGDPKCAGNGRFFRMDPIDPIDPDEVDCRHCICIMATVLTSPELFYKGSRSIRRVALVVDDFGIQVARQGRARAPVFTTPEGARFYDVTEGLTDAAGRVLFAAKEKKLAKLEDARRVLKKIEEEWRKQFHQRVYMRPPEPPAFRVFVGESR